MIQSRPVREDKYRTQPIIQSRDSTPNRQGGSQEKFRNKKSTRKFIPTNIFGSKLKTDKKKDKDKSHIELDEKFTHRSVQTERTDDLNKLYETGVIKYPSSNILKGKSPREQSPQKSRLGEGDANLETDLQNLGKNFE